MASPGGFESENGLAVRGGTQQLQGDSSGQGDGTGATVPTPGNSEGISGSSPGGCLVPVESTSPDQAGALWTALGEALEQGRLEEARTLYRLLTERSKPAPRTA